MDLLSLNSIIIYVILCLILVLYWKYKQYYSYWTSRLVTGPTPLPWFGTNLYNALKNSAFLEVDWLQKYGKVYGIYDGYNPIIKIADSELIKQVLVKDFHIFSRREPKFHPIFDNFIMFMAGKDWKRVRSIVSSSFTSGKMKKMFPIIRQSSQEFIKYLESETKYEKDIDMLLMYRKFVIDILTKSAYGIDVDLYNNQENKLVTNILNVMNLGEKQSLLSQYLPNFVKYTAVVENNFKEIEYISTIAKNIIEERRNKTEEYIDFIGLLTNAEKSGDILDVDVNKDDEENEKEFRLGIVKYLTNDEIIANATSLLMAANINTSVTLSFSTHELALNPEVQEKLYSEIMSSVDSNGEIDYDLLMKLPYLDAVISETLRMHSTSFNLKRIAGSSYKLGDTGVTLSKGQKLEIPIFAIHYSEEYFENPKQFDPDRFLPENKHKIMPYTYLPFGDGPRNCVAMRFAQLAIKLVLVHLIKEFEFQKSVNTDIPLLLKSDRDKHLPQRIVITLTKRN